MIQCLLILLTYAAATEVGDGGPCETLLSVEAAETFMMFKLHIHPNWIEQSSTERGVLVTKGVFPAPDRYSPVLVVNKASRISHMPEFPLVLERVGDELRRIDGGERGELDVYVNGRLALTSRGAGSGWEIESEQRFSRTRSAAAHAAHAFLRENPEIVRRLIDDDGVTKTELQNATAEPFEWEGRDSIALRMREPGGAVERLFFVRDRECWTAAEVTAGFRPHVDYLRFAGSLLYRTRAPQNDGLGLAADFEFKSVYDALEDPKVRALVGAVPHKFRELIVAPDFIDASHLPRLRAHAAREIPAGRAFTVLTLDNQDGGRAKRPWVAVLDEHSSREHLRLHFLRPKRLRLDGGRTIAVRFADDRWEYGDHSHDTWTELMNEFVASDPQTPR